MRKMPETINYLYTVARMSGPRNGAQELFLRVHHYRLGFVGRKVLTKPPFNNVLLRGRHQPLIFRCAGPFAIFGHQIFVLIENQNQISLFSTLAMVCGVDFVAGLSHCLL
jgi:hypothetical protein